ncbi:MAG: hypothetical protein AB7F93_09860 [Immundisolibacter sp.]
MLTNTLGIVIFVMIFTVLAAGGATVLKRLPMEHRTAARPLHFACTAGRLYHVDTTLIDKLLEGVAPARSITEFEAWSRPLDGRTASGRDVSATLRAGLEQLKSGRLNLSRARAVVEFRLLEGAGEPAAAAATPGSRFSTALAAHDSSKTFIHFFVMPDGIEAFQQARGVAVQRGYQTGWIPHTNPAGIGFTLLGSGRLPTAQ